MKFLTFIFALATIAVAGAPRVEEIVLTDLWDVKWNLCDVTAEGSTLFFICDLNLKTCRQDAIYFQSKADEIEAAGLKPCFIFLGDPASVRAHALDLHIKIDSYIDTDNVTQRTILTKQILPAIVRIDSNCNVEKIVYGGGEALPANLDSVLQPERSRIRVWFLIIAALLIASGFFAIR